MGKSGHILNIYYDDGDNNDTNSSCKCFLIIKNVFFKDAILRSKLINIELIFSLEKFSNNKC